MKKIVMILLCIVVYYACDDDDNSFQAIKADVSYSEFTDMRDMSVYKCITIGDQTWMAENLKYRSPQGDWDGCYTYYEEKIRSDQVKVNSKLFSDSIHAEENRGGLVGDIGGRTIVAVLDGWLPIRDPGSAISLFSRLYGATFPEALPVLQRIYDNLFPAAIEEAAGQKMEDAEMDNGQYSKAYGFLYTQDGARKAVPEGWRLPTDEDWKKLEKTLGMSVSELDKIEEWRGGKEGAWLKSEDDGIGFDALLGGCKGFGTFGYGTSYVNKGTRAYFWSSSKMVENDTTRYGITRILSINEDRIMRASSDTTAAYSVRCIKE